MAKTQVPPAGGGNVHETVPAIPETTAPSVPLRGTASFGGKIVAEVAGIKAITAVAQGPGEIAGPALAITLRVKNGSSKPVDLDYMTVNLSDSENNPGSSLSGTPAEPFSGTVPPGRQATGTYVFSVDVARRSPITLSLSYTTEAPVVVFVGNAP